MLSVSGTVYNSTNVDEGCNVGSHELLCDVRAGAFVRRAKARKGSTLLISTV